MIGIENAALVLDEHPGRADQRGRDDELCGEKPT